MATYAGFITAGLPGAVVSTLGLIAPSVIVVLLVAAFLNAFHENKYVVGTFYGLRPASSAMISAAGLVLARVVFAGFDFKAIALAAVLLFATGKTKFHPVVWIAFSAVVGIIFKF